MSLTYPEGTPTLGNTSVWICLAITDPTLAIVDISSDINAATSVNASCHLYPAGWQPDGTTAKGTKPFRLCSKNSLEQFNRTTYTLADLQYVYDPQADDSAAGNEVKEILVEGAEVYLVERIGLDAQTDAPTAAEKVVVHHVVVGPQIKSGDRTDENAEFYIRQSVIYKNDGPVDAVLAA